MDCEKESEVSFIELWHLWIILVCSIVGRFDYYRIIFHWFSFSFQDYTLSDFITNRCFEALTIFASMDFYLLSVYNCFICYFRFSKHSQNCFRFWWECFNYVYILFSFMKHYSPIFHFHAYLIHRWDCEDYFHILEWNPVSALNPSLKRLINNNLIYIWSLWDDLLHFSKMVRVDIRSLELSYPFFTKTESFEIILQFQSL